MKQPVKITKNLFADELLAEFNDKVSSTEYIDWSMIANKPQLADPHWKTPVANMTELLALTGNEEDDVRMVLQGENGSGSEVYTYKNAVWELIGANDYDINWDVIQGKPSTYPPSVHTHSFNDLNDVPLTFTPEAHMHDWADLNDVPLTFPPEVHTHPQYLTADDIAGLGGGDMVKAVYDADDDGIVDHAEVADSVDWSGVQNPPTILALGETNTTAYRGDRGKTAYDHSQSTHAPTNALTSVCSVGTVAPTDVRLIWIDTN